MKKFLICLLFSFLIIYDNGGGGPGRWDRIDNVKDMYFDDGGVFYIIEGSKHKRCRISGGQFEGFIPYDKIRIILNNKDRKDN